jgi:hypothetical protein
MNSILTSNRAKIVYEMRGDPMSNDTEKITFKSWVDSGFVLVVGVDHLGGIPYDVLIMANMRP